MHSTISRSVALSAALITAFSLSACAAASDPAERPKPAADTYVADGGAEADDAGTRDEPAEREPAESEEPSEPVAEQGSRENPWKAGDQLITDDWELVIGATNLDANDVVAEGNMFNDPPEAGFQYIQVPISVTYVGDESGSTMEIQVAYVAASGETYESWDAMAAVPDDNQMQELYSGGTASFNEYLMVPSEGIADGLLRVEVGMIGGAQGFVTLG